VNPAAAAARGGALSSPAGLLNLSALMLLLGTVGVLIVARLALAALLALGPVFIILALFKGTRGLFEGWLKTAVLFAVVPSSPCWWAAARSPCSPRWWPNSRPPAARSPCASPSPSSSAPPSTSPSASSPSRPPPTSPPAGGCPSAAKVRPPSCRCCARSNKQQHRPPSRDSNIG
jgi:hypothetical protein